LKHHPKLFTTLLFTPPYSSHTPIFHTSQSFIINTNRLQQQRRFPCQLNLVLNFNLFIHSLSHSFIHLFIFIRSFIHSFSLCHCFINFYFYPVIYLFIHSLIYEITHSYRALSLRLGHIKIVSLLKICMTCFVPHN